MAEGYYVGVPIPSYVYVGCPERAEFDKIGAEVKDHGLDENGNHLLTKAVTGPGNEAGRPVTIVFQHWLARETTDHMIERRRREREAKAGVVDESSTKRPLQSLEDDQIHHVYPTFGREHVTDKRADCWCQPKVDLHGDGAVIIHEAEQ